MCALPLSSSRTPPPPHPTAHTRSSGLGHLHSLQQKTSPTKIFTGLYVYAYKQHTHHDIGEDGHIPCLDYNILYDCTVVSLSRLCLPSRVCSAGGSWEPGGGGNSLKICDGYVRPHWPPFNIFKPPVTEWPPFYFSHFALTVMTPIFKMLSHLMTPFFRNISENGHHALTEWCPFSPINDHLVICTQYLFGRRDLCSC